MTRMEMGCQQVLRDTTILEPTIRLLARMETHTEMVRSTLV